MTTPMAKLKSCARRMVGCGFLAAGLSALAPLSDDRTLSRLSLRSGDASRGGLGAGGGLGGCR